jgi:tRNA threonylcarbamoyl adenosine modification protein (Sua5/YciO/YrdC/YwlC family)
VIDRAVGAMRAGGAVVLPTDTVYGLCADARQEDAVRRLYRLKGREEVQPTALIAAEEEAVFDALPELRGRSLLHGPYTLILPNPARRFRWLTGERPETIGVRLPALGDDAAAVVREIGVVAATSANLPGGRDPRGPGRAPRRVRRSSRRRRGPRHRLHDHRLHRVRAGSLAGRCSACRRGARASRLATAVLSRAPAELVAVPAVLAHL